MSIIRIYIYATVIHFERQLLTDLPKQKKRRRRKTHFQILLVKAQRTHTHPLTSLSLSLFMNNTPNLSRFSFHLSFYQIFSFLFLVDSSPGQQCLPMRAGSLPAGFSACFSISLFSLCFSLSFKHNSHSYMKMHGGSFLSPSRIFSLAWQEERVCVKLEEGKGRDESVSSLFLFCLLVPYVC